MIEPSTVSLAVLPTPLHALSHVSARLGVDVLCKRDDLTGSTLSGNKVRKLEYLLADARAQGADTILTCGGVQSNHCRATAVAARQLGLDSVLFLRTDDVTVSPPLTGNLLLDRVIGADVRLISRADYARRLEIMGAAANVLCARGRKPYVIPEGGSNALGSLGYLRFVNELAAQIHGPLTIVYAAGSGGTGAGLVAGVLQHRLPWRVVGVNVCDDRAYFVNAIGSIVEEMQTRFALSIDFDRNALEIVDGYVGRGYGRARKEELDALVHLARTDGIVLDPVYTGKAWYGLNCELLKAPRMFGERIVFLHSGGVYGLLAQADELSGSL